MFYFPTNPRSMRPRRSGAGILSVIFFLCIGGYFLYNMMPNLFHSVVPGKGGAINGEWIAW